MSENALSTHGVLVEWSSDDSTYYVLGDVANVTAPGSEADIIEVSDLAIRQKTYIAGMIDHGEFSAELNLLVSDPQHQALRDDQVGSIIYIHVTLPPSITVKNQLQFRGPLQSFGPIEISRSAHFTAEVKVKVSGAITWATAT